MYLISRSAKFARLFFILCFCGLLMYVVLAFYTFHLALTAVKKTNMIQYKMQKYPAPKVEIDLDTIQLKYILLWTTPEFKNSLETGGETIFVENNCGHLNCYLTSNKSLLSNVTKFDAIVFHINTLNKWKDRFPIHRSDHQKYVMYATVPANEHPICNIQADNFFNWTWSYKLSSDIRTPFIEVKDLSGQLLAPSLTVQWPNNINKTLNSTYPNKIKAIMWHNEQCDNEVAKTFVKGLKRHLPEHMMEIHVYGCDNEKCPQEGCEAIIEKYYFYLAFENSMSDDFVTIEVLKGYKYDAVPVVMGGADYSRSVN